MLKTTDNNCGIKIDSALNADFGKIANKKIQDLLSDENPNLLIFPNDLNQNGDKISDEYIFTLNNSILTTGNIMGFIGINESEITIQSRFAKNDTDYFLHYMLQKVFSINLFDLKHGINNETVFNFLLYLFPFYLKKAMRQGLYKEYHKKEYNDSNIKGNIDINRHIRSNVPFTGKIAYSVREHSYDNKITQLIRHTIEYIKNHKFAQGILDLDTETKDCVNEILHATPKYEFRERINVINKNLKPFSHPYFFEYRELKKICMQILKYEGIKYGKEKDKVYGLLFDGAWLWEEYLNTFLENCGFNHPKNKTSEGAIFLFKNSKGKRFPDFWKDNFILDAKYKRLAAKNASSIDRNDMNQIISYMYVKQAQIGGFIVPSDNDEYRVNQNEIGKLNGYEGQISIWALSIPQQSQKFIEFINQMKKNENEMVKLINNETYSSS